MKQADYSELFDQIKELGSGAYGQVYLSRKKPQYGGGTYAVKELEADKLDEESSIFKEINFLQDLSYNPCHEGVVCYYDMFQDPSRNNNIFIVMEYIEGDTLNSTYYQFLEDLEMTADNNPRLNIDLNDTASKFVLYMLKYIFKALDYIHSKGIVHADVKSDNILIRTSIIPKELGHRVINRGKIITDVGDGFVVTLEGNQTKYQVVFIDFGLSCRYTPNAMYSCVGLTVGTPAYYAPEIWQSFRAGHPAIYAESDIWALGITLYMMLTGESPWTDFLQYNGTDFLDIITSPSTSKPDFSTDFPFINSIGNQMLTYDYLKRPSAHSLYMEVDRYLKSM